MKIYIDSEYRCHTSNKENYREFDIPFFDDKCDKFIEGYRYIPYNESWTNENDHTFNGEMIATWKNFNQLNLAQYEYERDLLKEYKADLAELDLLFLDAQYNNLMEGL